MEVNASKTEAMHVERAADVGVVSQSDLRQLATAGVFKHVCECGEPFKNKRGLQIHQATYTNRSVEYELKEVLDVRDCGDSRFYLCHWAGYSRVEGPEGATWESADNLKSEQIEAFWLCRSDLDVESVHNVEGEFRCSFCCRGCKSSTGCKVLVLGGPKFG